jgi:hypothetical protein
MLVPELLGELARSYLVIEPGSVITRLFTVSHDMSLVFGGRSRHVDRGIQLCRPGNLNTPLSRPGSA